MTGTGVSIVRNIHLTSYGEIPGEGLIAIGYEAIGGLPVLISQMPRPMKENGDN